MKTAPSQHPAPARYERYRRWLAWVAAAAVLAAVFTAYLSPHTVVDLANRVWSCF